MHFTNLLHLDYWFTQPYIAFGWVMWFWVLIWLGLILAGIVLRIIRNYQSDNAIREVLSRFSNIGFTIGIFGLIWMFFRQERVAFLAWRFWLAVLAVIFIWWFSLVLTYTIKRLPEIKAEKTRREMMEKYLPKRK